MKTRKQKLSEIIEDSQDDLLRLQIAIDYKVELKDETPEGKKTLHALQTSLKNSETFLAWLNKQILLCE